MNEEQDLELAKQRLLSLTLAEQDHLVDLSEHIKDVTELVQISLTAINGIETKTNA